MIAFFENFIRLRTKTEIILGPLKALARSCLVNKIINDYIICHIQVGKP